MKPIWVLAGVAVFLAVTAVVLRRPAPPAERGPRGRVRVAAAADLNVALPAIVSRFGAAHDVDVTIAYGSSGTFFAQLLNEAPFDLFLSADLDYPNQLVTRGLTVPQSEFTYAVGRIVLWAPASSPLDVAHHGLRALTAPSLAHVAIANPAHAPYGRAAVAALESAGVYAAVQPKLVFGESVAQAMQFAQSGAADAGIVARSLALATGAGVVFEIPPATYPRMDQGGVILRWAADADAARALRGFLLSADGRAILERSGFALPER